MASRMESQITEETSATDCRNCERYKKLGDVCVVEHGKKFLWEFCKDFEQEVLLPDYKELMTSVRKDLAAERKKIRKKKKKERAERKRQKVRDEKLKSGMLEESEKTSKTQKTAKHAVQIGSTKSKGALNPEQSKASTKSSHKHEAINAKASLPPDLGKAEKKSKIRTRETVLPVPDNVGKSEKNTEMPSVPSRNRLARRNQANTPNTASSAKATA
jgi:hypothetical protein